MAYATYYIAIITDAPPGTIKTRLRRGRQLLRQCIEDMDESRECLDSTLKNLDGWARDLRQQLVARRES